MPFNTENPEAHLNGKAAGIDVDIEEMKERLLKKPNLPEQN